MEVDWFISACRFRRTITRAVGKIVDAGQLEPSYTRAVGSERASTTRQRERGQICYQCSVLLTPLPAWTAGARACDKCQPRPHRVLMNFAYRGGWIVHFVASDC